MYQGYTPGYLGTVVDTGGTVVYGTGYAYTPWIGNYWYAPPLTWGIAASPVYNPYVGFTFGFALGLTTAAFAYPYWGGAYYHGGYYGYPCCGSASANVYRNWGRGVSSGTRTWYNNAGGSFGTAASGSYATARGTTGSYNAQRSYNPYTGQGSQGYNRSFDTARGTTGSVNRSENFNATTGQRNYGSNVFGHQVPAAVRSTAMSARRRVRRDSTALRRRPPTTPRPGRPRRGTAAYRRTAISQERMAMPIAVTAVAASSSIRRAAGAVHRASHRGPAANSRRVAPRPIAPAAGAVAAGIAPGSGGGDWADRSGGGADRFGGGSGSWGSRFSGGSFGGRFGGGGFRGGGFRR